MRVDHAASRKWIIWAWMAVTVIAGMFPPWRTSYRRPSGYHLIFLNPPYPAQSIDHSRLLIEWILAAVLAGGAYFTVQTGERGK
jgi:hypothetical protein